MSHNIIMSTKIEKLSHNKLVKRAIKWLWSQGCAVVISEMAGSTQEPDAIGWHPSYGSTLIECKASRSDFLSDKHKSHHRNEESMGDKRYYLAPQGIIKPEELPEGWGLLQPTEKRMRIVEGGNYFPDKNWRSEIHLLISAMRRIKGKPGKGTSVRFYIYQTGNRATLGVKSRVE